MLLHLMRWLREHTDIDFDLLLLRGGDLVPDYCKVCTVFGVSGGGAKTARTPMPSRLGSVLRKLDETTPVSPRGPEVHPLSTVRTILAHRQIGLIYSNTVTNGRALAELALDLPIICHVHEVESYLQAMPVEELAAVLRDAAMYIVVAEATRGVLVQRGVDLAKIVLVPGFVPLGPTRARDLERRLSFRREHRIPEEGILVGGCGTLHWQKGPDLLVHVARRLARQTGLPPLHFAWVGKAHGAQQLQLRWDIERAGLTGSFSVIPGLTDTGDFFESLDILAIVSRNDPLPLIAVEAGARGVPVVCFEGNAELVDETCGIVVPYLDLEAYAIAVGELAEDSERRTALGRRLAAKVRGRHAVSAGASQIAEIIKSFAGTVSGH